MEREYSKETVKFIRKTGVVSREIVSCSAGIVAGKVAYNIYMERKVL